MDLAEAADKLYAGSLAEFVATRSELVKSARGDGDRSLATAIAALRKPSVAAWAVNMTVRHRTDAIEVVLAHGARLREAQRDLDGARIRDLSREAQALVRTAVAAAGDVASDLGARLSGAVETDVEQTLRAAMADPDATAAVRTGRLVAALPPSGLAGLDLSTVVSAAGANRPVAVVAAATPAESPPPPEVSLAAVRRLRAVERAVDEAQHAVRAAAAAVETAEARQSEARELVRRLRAELRTAEADLSERERDTRRAADALLAAEDMAADASRELAAVASQPPGPTPEVTRR